MAIIERIVTVYNDKGSKQALKDLNKLEDSFLNAGKNIAKAFGAATLAAGALATKLAVDGVQAAIADQKSQALLAQALKATTGATDAAIAGVEGYIDATQRAVNVTDDELRPSLATLVRATNDVAQAQKLQALALDISAGTTKDLQSVSLALAKAFSGNIDALTKLGVPLSDDIKKSKDLNAAFGELSKTFGGAAATRAQTFEYRLIGIKIAFSEVLETLGYALIPVLEEFARFVQTDLIPQLEQFVTLNKDEIAKGLADFAKFAVKATKATVALLDGIANNIGALKAFAAILVGTFVGGKVAAGVQILISALTLLTTTFKKQAAAGTAAGVATAFASGGLSAKAAAAGVLAFAAAAGTAYFALNKLGSSFGDTTTAIDKQSQVVKGHLADLNRLAQTVAQVTGAGKFDTAKDTQEAINLEAARLNLIREGRIEEAAKVAARQAEREALKLTIAEAQKYQDVLTVIADAKVGNEEIAVLAAKWGMSTEAVKNYLAQFFAVADKEIDKTEVELLAAAWGLTTEQAQKYLDFVVALKDSKLSPEEIAMLQEKWGMTVGEIEKYADFVLKVRDFKITDAEVKDLGSAWGLTNEEVFKYLEQIGVPFDYKGKFIDPVNGINLAWVDTKGSVDAYIESVGDADTALAVLAKNAETNANLVTDAFGNATEAAGALSAAGNAALEVASAAQTAAEAAIATAEMASAMAEGARAAAAAAEAAALAAAAAASAAATSGSSLTTPVDPGAFGDNTVLGGVGRGEYESGIFGPGAGTGATVNITVTGSVISEGDLVSTVRDGLLAGIGSGQVTTYDPRTIPG